MTPAISSAPHTGLFLREWLRRPLEVAAIAPSGRRLAQIITSEITAPTGPVLEIGPGTGVFTAQLLANGVAPSDLVLIERNPRFSALLRQRFPGVRVLNADAARVTQREVGTERGFGAAVSGLGLLSMERETVARILRNTFEALSPSGALYQFTYGSRCPVPRSVERAIGLRHEKIGRALINLPPAAVYKITRRHAHKSDCNPATAPIR